MSCLLCNLNLDEFKTCKIGWKGLKTLIQCSIDRKDNLADTLRGIETLILHVECRRRYTFRKHDRLQKFAPPVHKSNDTQLMFECIPISTINKEASTNVPRTANTLENASAMDNNTTSTNNINVFEMRTNLYPINPDNTSEAPDTDDISVNGDAIEPCFEPEIFYDSQALSDEDDPTKPFPFQHNCFICGKFISDDKKKPPSKRARVSSITKESTVQNIIQKYKSVGSSKCLKVLQRIQGVDLIQLKARYHSKCFIFYHYTYKGQKGRPLCPLILEAVDKICRYIDRCDRTEFRATELLSKELHGDYQPQWKAIEKKLELRYPGKIFFTSTHGYGTIVTVIKDSRPGSSMVVQPWNLNSTEFGGHGGTVEEVTHENLRRKQVQLNVARQMKQKKKALEANNTMDENNCYDRDDPESIEYDDDFIDETIDYQEVDETDVKENILICQFCLSSDRRLDDLGDYVDIVRKICNDIFTENFEPKLICWECIALLKNVQHFQKKIMIAQKLWNTKEPPKSLSTLSITTPSTVSNTDGNVSILSLYDQNSQEIVQPEVDILPQDLKSLREDERVSRKENYNMRDDTFDYDTTDMNVDDDSEEQESIPSSRRRKTKDLNLPKEDDTIDNEENDNMYDDTSDYDNNTKGMNVDDDSEEQETIPLSRRRRTRVKCNKVYNTEQDSEDETYTNKQKSRSISSSDRKQEDPDWGGREKQKKVKKKRIKVKLPYTILVQTYITATKMKREPIEPHELQYWLEAERNSDYFKNSMNSKCIKCILEVTDNHHKLFHSEEHPYVCKICECTFASNEEKDTHEANHYYIFSCELCRYKCYNETHMSHHVENHRRLIQCLECFAAFESIDVLKDHYSTLHLYAECDHCGKRFKHKHILKHHIDRFHVPQICTICNKQFLNHAMKQQHMDLKHRVERTEAAYCVQCDKQFDNEKQLKIHVYTSVKHIHEWKRHPKKKTIKEQHKCPECPKVYACRDHFQSHYNFVHAKKFSFYCQFCDKAFMRKHSYQMHMKKHEGYNYKRPKNKFCHICGRGFSTNKILENHIRTHSGERPFLCSYCPSSFTQSAALWSHIARVHEKPHRTASTAARVRT